MKVLLVEDNRGDARLIREMLRRGGAQFELTNVSRLSQALQRLGEGTFDVVLLDLGLPDSQGIDTFDRIHAQAPDAAVVVLSGLADEALAIETMKHGAQDYLVKGQVDSNPLVRAIRYAIERKRMEEHLSNENQLQDFLDNANDLIQSVGPDGRLLYVNRAWRETLGYTEEEAAKLSISDVVHPGSQEHCMGVFQRVMSGEKVNYVEAEFVAKDGRTVAVEGNVNCRFEDGKPAGTRGIFRNVTERKQAQEALMESEEMLRTTLETIGDGITITNMEGIIVSVNDAMCHMGGWRKEEVIGKQGFDFIAEQDRDMALETMMKAFDKGHSIIAEYRLLKKDGREYPVEASAVLLRNASGDAVGMINVVRDITERKQAEEVMRVSEEKLRIAFETMSDAIAITDVFGNIVEVNEATVRLHRYSSKEDIIGRNALDFIVEKDRAKAGRDIGKGIEEGGTALTQYSLLTADCREVEVEASASALHDSSGNPAGLIAVMRDITERKRMEEDIRNTAEKLDTILESMSDGVITLDMFGNITEANDTAVHMFECGSKEELIGKSALATITEQDRQKCMDAIYRSIEVGETPGALEFIMLTKSGKEFDAELATSMLHDRQGTPTGFVGVVRDITERRRAQEALRASEEKLRLTFASISDAIIITDEQGTIIDANDASYQISGYSIRELIGRNTLELIRRKDHDTLVNLMLKNIEEKSGLRNFVCGFVKKDGSEIEAEFSSTPMSNADGELTGFTTVARDITERKRVEEALRERVKELNCLYSMTRIVERDGITLDVIYQQLVDLLATSWHHPEIACSRIVIGDREFSTHNFRDSKWKQSSYIRVHGTAAGKVDVCYLEERPELDEGPFLKEERLLLDAVAERLGRITERKRMEEELRKTVAKLNVLFESIADGIVVADMNGTIIEANEAAVRIAGVGSKDEVLNKNGLDFIAEEDRERVANDLAKALFEGSPVSISQYSINAADGHKVDLEVHTSIMRDSDNNPVGFIVVERDVTERKQAEEAIRQRNRELRAINDIARVLSRPMRMDKMLNAALDSALDVTGMSSGGIWLADEAGGVLTAATYKGLSSTFKKRSGSIKVGEGVTGQAAETGEVVIVPDYLRNGKPNHSPRSSARLQGLQSIIGVPLKTKGKTLGVMTLFAHGYRPFSPGDIQLMETIGGEIGVAIENTQLLEKLGELSVTDELTGLFNRRRLYEVLDAEAARTQRYGHPFSLVIIDLDGFKQYNDTFGHVSGDVALEDFASAMRLTLRKTDVAFRHGGDEFAVILPSTDACKAGRVIQRLRTKWEQVSEVRYKSLKTPLGFSAGIAQLPGDAETADGLLAIADITMYHAKELGKYRTEMASGL